MQKKQILSHLLCTCLGIILGISVCTAFLLYRHYIAQDIISANELVAQGYVPLDEILTLDGYTAGIPSSDRCLAVYTKEEPEITLKLNSSLTVMTKNDYVFPVEDKVIQIDNACYIRKDLIESIINRIIVLDNENSYHLRKKQLYAHDWLNSSAPLIAHAGSDLVDEQTDGTIEAHFYTNSWEALVESYNNNYRVIELDFSMSSDGVLCCTHDWTQYDGAKQTEEWQSLKIDDLYTSMVVDDVMQQLSVNEDLYLVLDLKGYSSDSELEEIYQQLYESAVQHGGVSLLQRIIPQIYTMDEYEIAKDVYPWPSIIFTLYRVPDIPDSTIVRFVRGKSDIAVITMPKTRVSKDFCSQLHDAGKIVYTHTVNSVDTLYKWMNLGVDGFYTDSITPTMYESRYGNLK